jgi:Transposase DDE domain
MPVAGGGFDQCYNAQAAVATASLLVIATAVVQAPNDKQQIAPMLEKIDALSEQFGRPETLLADNGYFSEANVMQCAAAKIEPRPAGSRITPPGASDLPRRWRRRKTRLRSRPWLGVCGHRTANVQARRAVPKPIDSRPGQ